MSYEEFVDFVRYTTRNGEGEIDTDNIFHFMFTDTLLCSCMSFQYHAH